MYLGDPDVFIVCVLAPGVYWNSDPKFVVEPEVTSRVPYVVPELGSVALNAIAELGVIEVGVEV
jgi:hypothetical protein